MTAASLVLIVVVALFAFALYSGLHPLRTTPAQYLNAFGGWELSSEMREQELVEMQTIIAGICGSAERWRFVSSDKRQRFAVYFRARWYYFGGFRSFMRMLKSVLGAQVVTSLLEACEAFVQEQKARPMDGLDGSDDLRFARFRAIVSELPPAEHLAALAVAALGISKDQEEAEAILLYLHQCYVNLGTGIIRSPCDAFNMAVFSHFVLAPRIREAIARGEPLALGVTIVPPPDLRDNPGLS